MERRPELSLRTERVRVAARARVFLNSIAAQLTNQSLSNQSLSLCLDWMRIVDRAGGCLSLGEWSVWLGLFGDLGI